MGSFKINCRQINIIFLLLRFLFDAKSFNFGYCKKKSLRIRLPFLLLTALLFFQPSFGQKKAAYISGKVLDENENLLGKVSVIILGRQTGSATSDSGTFRIKAPAEKAFALVFSFTGYKTEQRNFLLSENEQEQIVVRLEKSTQELK